MEQRLEELSPELQRKARLLQPLMLAFPSAKISVGTIIIYVKALSVLSDDTLSMAIMKCMRTCKFFPSIAEIMEQADEMVAAVTGTKDKSPDEAWGEVQRQMEEAFVYKKPVFSTSEIEKAALSMGWIGLCETDTNNIGTIRAQFLKMYESVCKRKKDGQVNNKILDLVGDIAKLKQLR